MSWPRTVDQEPINVGDDDYDPLFPYGWGLAHAEARQAQSAAGPQRPGGRYGRRMTALRFRGPVLPDGESRELYVVDGRVTYEQQAGAETGAEGWIVPGLVDAHCHVGLDTSGGVDEATCEEQAVADRDAGALLLRDCGSPVDTSWIHDRDDLPRLIRAGRHIARTKRYIRNYAYEVEPGEVAATVRQEAQRGDGWVKLVGDWISREEGDLAPSFPRETFEEAIRVAHEHGARVTAHCFGQTVLPWLIEAGIDCIEHGTGLTTDLVDAMVEHGTALVPTVMQLDNFPQYAEAAEVKFPQYADHHARPVRAAARDDHVGLRGRRPDLRRHRRRRRAARTARSRARCCELAAYGIPRPRRSRRGVVAGPRVAGLERHPRRGRTCRLRRAGRRPAGRPVHARPPGARGAARPGRGLSRPVTPAAGRLLPGSRCASPLDRSARRARCAAGRSVDRPGTRSWRRVCRAPRSRR